MLSETELLGASWAEKMAEDIDAAHEKIIITALSVHLPTQLRHGNYAKLWQALERAAGHKLQIDFYLPASHAAHAATLKNNGVCQRLKEMGIYTHQIPPSHLLHAKTCVIDSEIVWVGSGNWTAAAANHNHEAYIRTKSRKIALDITARWELLA
jgi:phosphatidylserine/phosphatidylglycerophosphate/cardiolipin synthase-like enzyme